MSGLSHLLRTPTNHVWIRHPMHMRVPNSQMLRFQLCSCHTLVICGVSHCILLAAYVAVTVPSYAALSLRVHSPQSNRYEHVAAAPITYVRIVPTRTALVHIPHPSNHPCTKLLHQGCGPSHHQTSCWHRPTRGGRRGQLSCTMHGCFACQFL